MKNIFVGKWAFGLALALMCSSCNDWLNLLPNNEQVTENFWQSKEDVEAVTASGYYYMRQAVPTMLMWGELRGGDCYTLGLGASSKVQNFDMLPTNRWSQYGTLYQVISMANSVLRYAPGVQDKDNTYYTAIMNSHLCEALFQRAWAYSILVKNYKEVPLITEAYVNDDADMQYPKASESEIIAQIKHDVKTALDLGAAKGFYEEEWQTKSRATKWALYALMADICLWNHEYDECILYANQILDATDAHRPAFYSNPEDWFENFYPTKSSVSNEAIFELYWNYNVEGSGNNFTGMFPKEMPASVNENQLFITDQLAQKMVNELSKAFENVSSERKGRGLNATYISQNVSYTGGIASMSKPYHWKYVGTDLIDNVRKNNDANFPIYRVAEIILMKAEALVMKGQSSWKSAVALINQIRLRAGADVYLDLTQASIDDEMAAQSQLMLLEEIMLQRELEFVGEGKRWYDVLRMARYDKNFNPENALESATTKTYETYATQGFGEAAFEYKKTAIDMIVLCNTTIADSQLRTVLQNSWAWYLPLPDTDIKVNKKLKQNPYYE